MPFTVGRVRALCRGTRSHAPVNLRAEYERDVARALARGLSRDVLSEADLVGLPAPVQRYLRVAGVVNQPRVQNFRARMHGRIRGGPSARWMPFRAEQHNFFDRPARLFYLTASMFMVPVHGYHRYVGPSATMNVKAAGLFPIVAASGPEMDRTETVTMFNDMCMLAPATLISPAVAWEAADARTARAAFSNAGHTIHAELVFNDAGELIDFWSDDRSQIASDGSARQLRWSTPLGAYRSFGQVRLAAGGEARWREPDGEYAYIEIAIDTVEYNRTADADQAP